MAGLEWAGVDLEKMVDRMRRAALLEVKVYEEAEADGSLTREAVAVVALVSLAQGLGNAGAVLVGGSGIVAASIGLVGGLVLGLLGWAVWAYLTFLIGTNMFRGSATPEELLRTLAYAQTPGLLSLASVVPCLGALVAFGGSVWTLVCGVVAIRQALDVDTAKAVFTALVGWLILFALRLGVLLFTFLGGAALGHVVG